MTMNRNTEFINALRADGMRVTRQRQMILEVLEESQGHLDAGAIYEKVRAVDPSIGLATVYRTLALLKEMGLVQEHRLGEEHGHFETLKDEPHYHFTCNECGQVIEFEAPVVMEIVQDLAAREGLRVDEVHLFVRGQCASCVDSRERR
jgi:Fe2+ or Zn2+ uptake regulation protein